MKIIEPLIAEFIYEISVTKKMLERLSPESFNWRPHPKSRSLRELAIHIIKIPVFFIIPLNQAEFDHDKLNSAGFENAPDLVNKLNEVAEDAVNTLKNLTDKEMLENWTYKYGQEVIFSMPRLAVLRTMGLNHLVHHRGQLSVYLRMLNIPLPNIYGPTADEK